jgi:CheY-like chemotaxis protein
MTTRKCRKLLVWFLELHGFRTISATCGLEAVEFAIEFQSGLVLMDLSMPGMNGFEATQAIHTQVVAGYPHIALITDIEAGLSRTSSHALGNHGRKKRFFR